jgi:citrate lyase subunit beta/citryl-CoA lyase
MIPSWRSLLFVPADRPDLAAKAARGEADAVIVDLEDAVAPAGKAEARASLSGTVAPLRKAGRPVVVRINVPWDLAYADLAAASAAGADAIMVPKTEGPDRLAVIGEMLGERPASGGPRVLPGLIALIESPQGLANLDRIARVHRLIGLALGSEDFSLAMGVQPTSKVLEHPCRMLALAAARAGVMGIAMPLSIATIADDAAWSEAVASARAVGLNGALCIHPRQVGLTNAGFAPSDHEVARAQRIVEAWDGGEGAGVFALDGAMIDLPVLLSARRTLERAAAAIRQA